MAVVSDFTRNYLQRIHCDGLYEVSVQNLFQLHKKHLEHTVFENVNCFLKRKLKIDKDFLFNKIILEKKGGFCFELNTLFYFLLKELGYDVEIFQACVYNGRTNILIPGKSPSHVLNMVSIDGKRFLADVAFGCRSFQYPLEFKQGETDQGLRGVFKLTRDDNDQTWILQSRNRYDRKKILGNQVSGNFKDGWCNEYLFKEISIGIDFVQEMLEFHLKDPLFIFNRILDFERLLPNGYKILFGDDFSDIQFNVKDGGVVIKTLNIKNDMERLNVLRNHFNCYYVDSFERV